MMMLMKIEEKKEEKKKKEENMLREKSNNPNLKGGEKHKDFLCKFKSVLIAKPFILPLQIFVTITNNTSFSQNSRNNRRI